MTQELIEAGDRRMQADKSSGPCKLQGPCKFQKAPIQLGHSKLHLVRQTLALTGYILRGLTGYALCERSTALPANRDWVVMASVQFPTWSQEAI